MEIDSQALRDTGHAYVHVPFCGRKCAYCALYSVCDASAAELAAYPSAVAAELDALSRVAGARLRPTTIYIGGGTPTLPGARLGELLAALRSRLDLSRLAEFTVESRPEFVTPELAATLAANGVNRVSMGVQTTDGRVLRAIGRDRSADSVPAAFANLRAAGIDNIGIDLIVGLPGASATQTVDDIRALSSLAPAHVSVYSLIVEPGTPLARLIESGEAQQPDDDALMDAIAMADGALSSLGFARYEISNYAKPGRECRYNLSVWRGEDYVGLGPSASSRVGRVRWTDAPDVRAYDSAPGNGMDPPRESETQSAQDDAEGRFIFQLRLAEGCDPRAFAASHPAALALLPMWESALAKAEAQGLATRDGARWRLTRRGFEVADSVIETLCT